MRWWFFCCAAFIIPFIAAQEPPSYLGALIITLNSVGLNRMADAVAQWQNQTDASSFPNSISRGAKYTLYTPVDESWPNESVDLTMVLPYHFALDNINSTTQVARPRRHTIAFTELRDRQHLPGTQGQVLVLEQTPTNDTEILIRGPDWNATTRGGVTLYNDIIIQPISRVLAVPLSLTEVLKLPLDSSAPKGATAFLSLLQGLSLPDCRGCTYFVPNDAAIASANLSRFDAAQQRTIILTHIITGDVRYSPGMQAGQTWIGSSGATVAYGVNGTGAYVTSGGFVARITRSDILVDNGVVHLISAVLAGTVGNADAAAIAASEASKIAATRTVVDGVLGGVTKSAVPLPSMSRSAAKAIMSGIRVSSLITIYVIYML